MKLTTGSVLNMTPAGHDWVVAFDLGGETGEVVCPVIGWATVVTADFKDGTVHTEVKPAFVWGDMVWTESELREHAPEITSFEIRAREITRPVTEVKVLGHSIAAEAARYGVTGRV
ncbi:hypothetical protein [Streptomyces shenzhenensis]|uniref:hypothetical protein n=1 Tax=Streptomyces shenzhenensis TaxID=943815 RepID=UPI0034056B3E